MGKLIWHEYARFVSITATICESIFLYVNADSYTACQTAFGLDSGAFSTANSSGTLLVVLCVTQEVSSTSFSLPLASNNWEPNESVSARASRMNRI